MYYTSIKSCCILKATVAIGGYLLTRMTEFHVSGSDSAGVSAGSGAPLHTQPRRQLATALSQVEGVAS